MNLLITLGMPLEHTIITNKYFTYTKNSRNIIHVDKVAVFLWDKVTALYPRHLRRTRLRETLTNKYLKFERILKMKNEAIKAGGIFPIGPKNDAYAKYFVGQSYLQNLVADPQIDVGVGNVTFEPGCRNNWHIHHNGFQILLVIGGEGWYQEEGKTAQHLTTGDVVVTHEDVKHWRGATKDSWFTHVAITAGTPEWLEPVSEEQYAAVEEDE